MKACKRLPVLQQDSTNRVPQHVKIFARANSLHKRILGLPGSQLPDNCLHCCGFQIVFILQEGWENTEDM